MNDTNPTQNDAESVRSVVFLGQSTKNHPWKKGEVRNVFEFSVTRKIIVEADSDIPDGDIVSIAGNYQPRDMGSKIMSGKYSVTLSIPNKK